MRGCYGTASHRTSPWWCHPCNRRQPARSAPTTQPAHQPQLHPARMVRLSSKLHSACPCARVAPPLPQPQQDGRHCRQSRDGWWTLQHMDGWRPTHTTLQRSHRHLDTDVAEWQRHQLERRLPMAATSVRGHEGDAAGHNYTAV